MNTAPFLSIIIPVYKVEAWLPRCMQSLLGQRLQNFEIILVDDGSPDNCPALCDQYARAHACVRVVHKENGGSSSARNAGLRLARGAYIAFVDSDDFWADEGVTERLSACIAREAPEVLVLRCHKFQEATQKLLTAPAVRPLPAGTYEERLTALMQQGLYNACPWDKVFARHLMDRGDLFFIEGCIAEDVDWCARLMLLATSISLCPEPVYVYRIGRPGSVTGSLKLRNLVDTHANLNRCLGYPLEGRGEHFLHAYYSYLAYRYVIWMAESTAVKDPAKNPLIKQLRPHASLLRHDLHPRVRLVHRLYRLLGYRCTARLLEWYLLKGRG